MQRRSSPQLSPEVQPVLSQKVGTTGHPRGQELSHWRNNSKFKSYGERNTLSFLQKQQYANWCPVFQGRLVYHCTDDEISGHVRVSTTSINLWFTCQRTLKIIWQVGESNLVEVLKKSHSSEQSWWRNGLSERKSANVLVVVKLGTSNTVTNGEEVLTRVKHRSVPYTWIGTQVSF